MESVGTLCFSTFSLLKGSHYIVKTFDDISPEKHKEVCFKVLKHWLKNYYKLDGMAFPQSGVLKQEELLKGSTYPGDSFCLKLDIEKAIDALPHRLKKHIFLHYMIGLPIAKICLMCGMKFRVDAYRRLEECFERMYDSLGPHWLRNYEIKL